MKSPGAKTDRELELGAVTAELDQGQIRDAAGQRTPLTELEQRLLGYLADRSGEIVEREELLRSVWGIDEGLTTRSVDIAISRLRTKIEADPSQPRFLVTHRGRGYRLDSGAPRIPAPVEHPLRAVTEGGWIDVERRCVYRTGQQSTLGDREAANLRTLLAQPGRPVSTAELRRRVWGDAGDTGPVRTALRRLRRKIEVKPDEPRHLVSSLAGLAFVPSGAPAPHRRTNIDLTTPEVVGRRAELLEAAERLRDAHRLVVVRGIAGIGKTRFLGELLAREEELAGLWEGGLWLATAQGCQDEEQLWERIAEAMGLPVGGISTPTAVRVCAALRRWGASIVAIDGCEGSLEAVQAVTRALLEGAGDARVVLASRVRPALPAHALIVLEPLPSAEAQQLLELRIGERSLAVTELAAALEGIPLVLELAAGQAALVGAQRLLDRVRWGGALRGPAGGPNEGRAVSLERTLSASWDLLDGRHAEALQAFGLFGGTFLAEDADAVLGAGGADVLAELVDASLVQERPLPQLGGRSGFTLYEAVRHSAARRFAVLSGRQGVQARHEAHVLQLGERLAHQLGSLEPGHSEARLQLLKDDLLELARTQRRRAPERAARARMALLTWTRRCESPRAVERLLERAEADARASGSRELLARVLAERVD